MSFYGTFFFFSSKIKIPGKGFKSDQWSCVEGRWPPAAECEAATEAWTPPRQPLLPDRREKSWGEDKREEGDKMGVYFHEIHYTGRMLRGFNIDGRKRQGEREEEVEGLERTCELLPGAAATDTSQAGSPWRAIWGPESWFPEGQSCPCSVPHGASWGKDPSRAGESRPASDAAEKRYERGQKQSQNDCRWSLSSHDVLITIDGS